MIYFTAEVRHPVRIGRSPEFMEKIQVTPAQTTHFTGDYPKCLSAKAGRVALALLVIFLLLTGCDNASYRSPDATCIGCHQGLEPASKSHSGCVSCHGGDGTLQDKDASHRKMYGPKNPSDPRHWEKTCGACHQHQLERIRASLMYTNTGMIKNIQQTWEGEDGVLYASRPEKTFDDTGKPLQLRGVTELDNLSGELYRKFCALCHVGLASYDVWSGSHGAGCSACHFPTNENATYQGGDPTVKGKWPHSASHQMATLPDITVCVRCHNRSGRIAFSYQGLNDGNNAMVPTLDGQPGPRIASGARNLTSIPPDIHFSKGMDCIDCHTSRDIMGDGHTYENLYLQVEIACEDCHGSVSERPRLEAILRENEDALRESRSYAEPTHPGMQMVLTSKGRKYSNVFWDEAQEKIFVRGKRSGKLHESKVITGTPEHTIVGHQRMECYACHSRTVVQCYGCHTRYDQGKMGMDYIKGYQTPGAFSESEDYRTLYPFPLALNQRGRISTVTPGCQTFVTVTDPAGEKISDGYVSRFKGKNQLRFAPFFSHNTGPKAIGCGECHGNPAFLGFGQHVTTAADIEATLLCERSGIRPLDGFMVMEQGKVRSFSAITRDESRPLNAAEIRKVWQANLCLGCHADPKDPIYQKELDYGQLESCLRRPGAASSPRPGAGG
jgi:hypothetical protein